MSIKQFKNDMINKLSECDFVPEIKTLVELTKNAFKYEVVLEKDKKAILLGQYTDTFTIALEINEYLGRIFQYIFPLSDYRNHDKLFNMNSDIQDLINEFADEMNKFAESL